MGNKNIVYLLGAGASFNSIPIVSTMVDRMRYFLRYLEYKYPNDKDEFVNLHKLCDDSFFFGTPDTLARKIFISRGDDVKLKNLLSTFLIFEQLKKEEDTCKFYSEQIYRILVDLDNNTIQDYKHFQTQIDQRYLSFFATIMDRSEVRILLPANVSIISWNYDSQVELAYQKFSGLDLMTAQRKLSLFPSQSDFGDYDSSSIEKSNSFSVVKLNGTAGYYNDTNALFDPAKHSTNKETMDLIRGFLTDTRDSGNLLNFAWETNDPAVNKAREITKSKIKQADAIVIIGYSFPDFNRLIDKEIFAEEQASIVYLQDPDANKIVQKLEGVKRGMREKTRIETQTNNFIIPFEYWEENS